MLTRYDPTVTPLNFPSLRELNSNISDELEELVLHAIQLKQADRYNNVDDLKKRLKTYLTGYTSLYVTPPVAPQKKLANIWARVSLYFLGGTIILPFIYIALISIFGFTYFNREQIIYIIPMSIIFLSITGVIISLIGAIKGKRHTNILSGDLALKLNLLLLLIILISGFFLIFRFLQTTDQEQLILCESNLRNLSTAIEIYAKDNEGLYPPDLDYITYHKIKYLDKLPICPVSGTSYIYMVSMSLDGYTLCCGKKNSHFYDKNGYWPQYWSREGLKLSPD